MRTLRVLVAEDDEDHRYLTVRALRQAVGVAMEIVEARDGQETLDCLYGRGQHVHSAPPNLVFLDLRMPKATGFEVLERLKSDATRATIPVVVVTSSRDREDIDMAYALGTNSYVTKTAGPELSDHLGRMAEYWVNRSELPNVATTDS